jgi:hypothetical protein
MLRQAATIAACSFCETETAGDWIVHIAGGCVTIFPCLVDECAPLRRVMSGMAMFRQLARGWPFIKCVARSTARTIPPGNSLFITEAV